MGQLVKEKIFSVVFSAFSGVTDQPIHLGKQRALGDEGYKKVMDELKARHISATEYLLSHQRFIGRRGKPLTTISIRWETCSRAFLVREASPRTMDFIQSYGERLSNMIIVSFAIDRGYPASYLDARQCVVTNLNMDMQKSISRRQTVIL